MQFSPGEQVSFEASGHGRQTGILVKFNKKTVTVMTEAGQKWNESPQLLSKVKNTNSKSKGSGKIIDLSGKQ